VRDQIHTPFGKSTRSGSRAGYVRSSRAAITMRFWRSMSCGAPSGNPSGRSTTNARGGWTRTVTSRSKLIETVGIPDFSITL
jgi:hypothetical protein